MFDPARVRVGGDPAGQFGDRELPVGGEQDRVAEAAAAQHGRVGGQRQFGEDGGGRGDLAAQMGQRRAVGQVRRVEAAGPQRPPHLGEELGAGQMGGGTGSAEHVRDDQVRPAVLDLGEAGAGVGSPDPYAGAGVERQLPADEPDQGPVELHDLLRGAGPSGGDVPGEGEAPPPRCTAWSGRFGGAARSTAWPRRRWYSNERCAGSSRSTCDCGAPSRSSVQARGRSRSGTSSARPPSTVSVRGPPPGRAACSWPSVHYLTIGP